MQTKPKFTNHQMDFICYQIGEWYVGCKDNLVDFKDKTHRLGYAREILKSMICGDERLNHNGLMAIDDHNEMKKQELIHWTIKKGTGVACPECGNELHKQRIRVPNRHNPLRYPVICSNEDCQFTGSIL